LAHALSTAVFKALFNEVMYDFAAQSKATPAGAEPGRLDAAAMAGGVIAAPKGVEDCSSLALNDGADGAKRAAPNTRQGAKISRG
jgi:hypothetical protein